VNKLFSLNNPRSRIILGLCGVVLLVSGIGLIAWAVTSLGGDDGRPGGDRMLSEPVIEGSDLVKALDLPSPTPSSAPASPTAAPAPPLRDAPYRIVIDKIGVDAPVQTYGLDENAVPEVPLGGDARGVVAWYDFSARPGTGSNAVFAGHVTWSGRAVFYSLDELQNGDMIHLLGQDGTEVVYSVSSVFQVNPDDPESLKVMYGTDKDVITLITCSGTFQSTSDPVFGGEYNLRLVVRGDLVSITPAAQAANIGN